MKVALGLSGGVDSAVAGYLLQKQGYEVTGVYIQCWNKRADGCSSDEDKKFALRNALKLGIKFVTLDFVEQYKAKVIEYFYSEYKAGRTPNPDVLCNKEIKFGIFYKWAMDNGFDYVATGHYARIIELDGTFRLLRAVDSTKDQSYFLYLLDPAQFSKILFPVGNMLKKEVRKLAAELDLPSKERPESMGICFIGEVDIRKFLEERYKPQKGAVLNTQGVVIGEHGGVWFYTVGQRHGFKVAKYSGSPLYVISKDAVTNSLVVGSNEEAKGSHFTLSDFHSLRPVEKQNVLVRIRHLGELYTAQIQKEIDNTKLEVMLDKPVFGIAPGQSAVLYDGEMVLGGGIIT